MLKAIIILIGITFIPGLELRASIPVGILGPIKETLSWPMVFLVCVLANIALGWCFYLALYPLVSLARHIRWIDMLFVLYLERAQRKLKPSIEKYGTWGLAIFIGIPLPLTGAYTGAAGAFALGMGKRQFMIANAVGVLLAGIVVTIISLLIQAGVESPWFDILIKHVQ